MNKSDATTVKRILLAGIVLAAWVGGITWRLVDLQLRQHDDFVKKAAAQQKRIRKIPAVRGSIFDRNGSLLAVSRKSDTVYIAPAKVTDEYLTARKLNEAFGLDRQKIIKTCRRDFSSIYVMRLVSPQVADRIRELNLAGVGLEPENDRHYPQGPLACHVLGYTFLFEEKKDEDSEKENAEEEKRGRYGVEEVFDEAIAGRPGEWFVHRDALGQTYGSVALPATAGDDLVVSIDEVIQYHTERALDKAMEESRAEAGTVVVMDVNNGDILAMANRPGFDPNDYGRFSADEMSNRAVTRIYEPGSTFKLVTMAAALEAGTVKLDELIDCGRGKLKVDGGWIHDHKSFDKLTAAEVIAYSSNVGAMRLGIRTGKKRMHGMITAFGFGRKTGIQAPLEEKGLVKPIDRWSGRTCATISFGQEVSVTPLQLCRAVAAIANGGELVVPRLVLRIQDLDGHLVSRIQPKTEGRIISTETAAALREMMAGVVEFGTGEKAASKHYRTAGKTGTAQMIVDGKYSDSRFVASFAGFAPVNQPRIAVVAVFSDVRRPNYHGGQVAAPVFREVVDAALRRLAVPSSQDEILIAGVQRPGEREEAETVEAG